MLFPNILLGQLWGYALVRPSLLCGVECNGYISLPLVVAVVTDLNHINLERTIGNGLCQFYKEIKMTSANTNVQINC